MKKMFFYVISMNTCTYFVYFKSEKELNYDRLSNPNILGDAPFYESIEFSAFPLT